MIKNLLNKFNEFETEDGKYEYYIENSKLYQRLSRPFHSGHRPKGIEVAHIEVLKFYDGSEYEKLVGLTSKVSKYVDGNNIGSTRNPEYVINKK